MLPKPGEPRADSEDLRKDVQFIGRPVALAGRFLLGLDQLQGVDRRL